MRLTFEVWPTIDVNIEGNSISQASNRSWSKGRFVGVGTSRIVVRGQQQAHHLSEYCEPRRADDNKCSGRTTVGRTTN